MRRLSLLLLVALAADAGPGYGIGGGLTTCPKGYIGGGLVPCVSSSALFEFGPATGVGMGAACACAAVTSSAGNDLAMTRASSATCQKGGSSVVVAPGDFVTCAVDLPRIEATGGVLGYLREGAGTNVCPRSEEIDNAAWSDYFLGVGAPLLNGANAAPSPFGVLTAEDYTFAATTTSQYSGRSIPILTAAPYSAQLFIRGVNGPGQMDLCIQTGASTATCSTCSFVAGSYTQCKVLNVTSIASGSVYVGNMTGLNGGIDRAINRVYVWGLDAETGAGVSSYIPTAGASVTRQADSALTGTARETINPYFSVAATIEYAVTAVSTQALSIGGGAPQYVSLGTSSDTSASYTISSTVTTPAVPAIGSTVRRTSLRDSAGSRAAYWDGTAVAAPAVTLPGDLGASTDTDVTYVAGILGGAALFNGASSKIQTAAVPPTGAAPRTISLWFRPDVTQSRLVFGYGTASSLTSFDLLVYGGTVYLNVVTNNCIAPGAYVVGAWNHVVATYDGSTITIRLNGGARGTLTASLATTAVAAVIGTGINAGWPWFQGSIDEVDIWDRALTIDEEAGLYNGGVGIENLTGSLLVGATHQWHLNGVSNDLYFPVSIGAIGAWTSKVCVDPNPSRCR